MVKFAIPSSRIHLWRGDGIEGGTNIPAQPRVVGAETAILVGGAAIVTDADKYYVAVGASGSPLKFKGDRKIIFKASSPSAAATKFFNSWWKSTNQGPCSSGYDFADSFANISESQLAKTLLVRVAEVKGGKVSAYLVKYVPNTKPNVLETKNKIVCTSKATPLTSLSVKPRNTIELESNAAF